MIFALSNGPHKHSYCQAQPNPNSSSSWLAEFSLILIYSYHPAGRPAVRNSSEIDGNQQNLLSNSCRSTLVKQKPVWKYLKRWKTTSMEDDLNGRQPQWKTTSMEDDLNGRRPQWKTTSMEDNLNRRRPQRKMSSM